MTWYVAMLAVFPLMIWTGKPTLWSPKVRSWLTLMAASLATYIHQSLGFYIAIDLIGAALILAYPATQWQRAIGLLFVVMGFLCLGNFMSFAAGLQNSLSAAASINLLMSALISIGWAQFAILLGWGGYDLYRHYRADNRTGGAIPVGRVER